MRQLHPWLTLVHAHMLAHGERMSSKDAVRFFGEPQGTTAAKLMHSAMNSGYFRAELIEYEGRHGLCSRTVFTAVNREGRVDTSWWNSINRVNSVWQLAEVVR